MTAISISKQLSTHLHQVYFGGNWTEVNIKDTLAAITVEVANHKIEGFNTILALTYHIHYFVKGVIPVFKGGKLEIRDKFSFQHPKIETQTEWEKLQMDMWEEAEELIELLSQFPNENWDDYFTDEKYGSYFSNFIGLIEHTHYHLGQIVIIKKMVASVK